jgi:hypothetical protein
MITKVLKNYLYEYDPEKNMLYLSAQPFGIPESPEVYVLHLDKTRMFSLARFLIRVSQKLSSKRRVAKSV